MTFYVPVGCVRFARYCGIMYSRHLFFHTVDWEPNVGFCVFNFVLRRFFASWRNCTFLIITCTHPVTLFKPCLVVGIFTFLWVVWICKMLHVSDFAGYLQSRAVYFLMNSHIKKRSIYLCRVSYVCVVVFFFSQLIFLKLMHFSHCIVSTVGAVVCCIFKLARVYPLT